MKKAEDVVEELKPLGFERVELIHGNTYKDCSTVIISPTRGMIHHKVVSSWQSLIAPMNQKRAWFIVAGDEVGHAYNRAIENVLAHPELSKYKYVLTLEDDNLPLPNAHLKLIESIEDTGWDVMAGIYFTKGPVNMPQAYGDPDVAPGDFTPRDVREALKKGQIMKVNGVAMGCTLYRMELFKEIPGPWFVTVNEWIEGVGNRGQTQDLNFCSKAIARGKNLGVDMRVRVGHVDVNTGDVY